MELHRLAAEGDLGGVRRVLAGRRPPVNIRDDKGRTPLYHACVGGNAEIVLALMDAGGSLFAAELYGESLLYHAGSREVAQLLLGQGLEVNELNRKYSTPLVNACKKENLDIISALIDFGADVDKNNPLHVAICYNNIELVTLLLDAGARVQPADGQPNCFPIHWAIKAQCAPGGRFIHYSFEDRPPISEICASEFIELFLERGADVNQPNLKGNTPLHLACKWNKMEIVKQLVINGADRHAHNFKGDTPMDLASPQLQTILAPAPKRA